jgi:hypothetical protein
MTVNDPRGIIEEWNDEIMGYRIMQCRINGRTCIDDKIKNEWYPLKNNLPLFHTRNNYLRGRGVFRAGAAWIIFF